MIIAMCSKHIFNGVKRITSKNKKIIHVPFPFNNNGTAVLFRTILKRRMDP